MINLEGCGRKGIRRKIVGMMEVVAPISLQCMGWHPAGLLVRLSLLSSPRTIKSRRWHAEILLFRYHPVGTPHLTQIGCGETQSECSTLAMNVESRRRQ